MSEVMGQPMSLCPECGHDSLRENGICGWPDCSCNCDAASAEVQLAMVQAQLEAVRVERDLVQAEREDLLRKYRHRASILDAVRAERDALLEAMKEIAGRELAPPFELLCQVKRIARDAIAKVSR